MRKDLHGRPGGPVGPGGAERIPDVYDGQQARSQRDLLAAPAARIARVVPFLVVALRNIQRRPQKDDGREQGISVGRILAHENPFGVRQRPGLEQDMIRYAHLADVVQKRPAPHVHQRRLTHAIGLSQLLVQALAARK
jgi:hypothetical protein